MLILLLLLAFATAVPLDKKVVTRVVYEKNKLPKG